MRTVVGTITDEDDKPIGEAEVAITGWGRLRTFSDSQGAYRLRSVPLGELELVVSAPGYWDDGVVGSATDGGDSGRDRRDRPDG